MDFLVILLPHIRDLRKLIWVPWSFVLLFHLYGRWPSLLDWSDKNQTFCVKRYLDFQMMFFSCYFLHVHRFCKTSLNANNFVNFFVGYAFSYDCMPVLPNHINMFLRLAGWQRKKQWKTPVGKDNFICKTEPSLQIRNLSFLVTKSIISAAGNR